MSIFLLFCVSVRVCTAVAFIACATIAGVFVRRAWEKFSKSPIVVNVETTNYPLYKLHFPAITICPANNVKKTVGEELLARHLNMTLDSNLQQNLLSLMSALSICQYPFYFRMQAHFKPIFDMLPLFSDFNVSRFMLQVLPKCSEVFESCFWLGKEVDCCDVFHLQRTEAGFCYSFNSLTSDDTWSCAAQDEFSQHAAQKEKDEYTKCQPRHNIASGTTTGFEVFLLHSNPENSLGAGQRDKNGFRVYLHHPTHFPEAGKGVFLPEQKGKAFRVEVTPSVTQSSAEVRALSIAQRQCLFPDEMRLQVFHTYTQQNCLMECRLHHVANFCGCHPYFFSAFTGKYMEKGF
ncbi:hypothetical protein ANN_07453 [Periplaneta americana]|uniref:Uncharacterized protein n=1 Tax=Periplaneta americana TaxID=6978 RepID=A0ABQ8SYS4_PERAM|nr:hypothetical protein ANN_07453 [Periplaneta americana]